MMLKGQRRSVHLLVWRACGYTCALVVDVKAVDIKCLCILSNYDELLTVAANVF